MPAVRTVLGDVPAAELGVCDAHDHLFFRSAQLAGQELDDADAAVGELSAFAALGGRAVVQWTPFGLGRRADLLAGVSRAAGVAVIAAAEAHRATGAPIGVHHELGTAAADVAELLCEQLQVPADKVILGHLNRLPDSYLQRQVAETGAFLGFDGPSRANHATDWRLHECLAELVRHGHEDQILIGGDTTTAAAGGRTRRGRGGEVLHREPGPGLQLGLKASAWAWAHWANVRGSRPVTSRTSGWGCDSSSVPVT